MKKIWNFVKNSKTKLLLALTGLVLAPSAALAQSTSTSSFFPALVTQNSDLATLVRTILNVVFGFAGVIAVGYLIYGGYQYITSGGGDGAENAKKTIINAIIGIIVIVAAFAIANYVWSLFGLGQINNQNLNL
jgi:hypothetical protein